MALTSIKNDDSRINRQLDLMTFEGRYMLGIPGPGNIPFQEDVFIRLQKNGANMRTNSLNIENSLLGLNKPLTKDRAIMPAWTARDLEQNNFNYLLKDPQKHSIATFQHNTSSRIEEINNYNNS